MKCKSLLWDPHPSSEIVTEEKNSISLWIIQEDAVYSIEISFLFTLTNVIPSHTATPEPCLGSSKDLRICHRMSRPGTWGLSHYNAFFIRKMARWSHKDQVHGIKGYQELFESQMLDYMWCLMGWCCSRLGWGGFMPPFAIMSYMASWYIAQTKIVASLQS